MTEERRGPSREEFDYQVRDALIHLYDLAYLQTHALVNVVSRDSASDTIRGKLLRRQMLDALETLRPDPGTPAQSRAWRSHRLLELRYVEGLSVEESAEQLGMSRSQYHREHARALDAVVSLLWERWGPDVLLRSEQDGVRQLGERGTLARAEINVVSDRGAPPTIDLHEVMTSLNAILGPLSKQQRAPIRIVAAGEPTLVARSSVVLRQALLGVLTQALTVGAGNEVEVTIGRSGDRVETRVRATVTRDDRAVDREAEILREFVQALEGELTVETTPDGSWTAVISLPVATRRIILIVDNSSDFVDLVSRYLEPHGWQVIGAVDAHEAMGAARRLHPRVILLDLVLPGEDGWDLMLRLKTEPDTRDIPVVICSILNEPQLAFSLGAAGYVLKPVTELSLLRALARW